MYRFIKVYVSLTSVNKKLYEKNFERKDLKIFGKIFVYEDV